MFTGLNIESSAICNLKCHACPTSSYSNEVKRGYFSPKLLYHLDGLPSSLKGSDIDLTGWGETLLSPYLVDLLKYFRGATFTTNATLLDRRWADRIVELGVSAVAFSIDSAREQTYRRIHGGGDCELVWNNVKGLAKIREEAKSKAPFLSAHFLLMRSNVEELTEFVERASDAGVDEVVVKHVAIFSHPAQVEEAMFSGFFKNQNVDENLREQMIEKAKKKAQERGITFRKVGRDIARPVAGCFGGAITRPFIAWDGRVSPCCVLSHRVPRINEEGIVVEGAEFFVGDIKTESLEEIWHKPEYVEHRQKLSQGSPPTVCVNCLGAWSVTVEEG